jgi:hypothetical protein
MREAISSRPLFTTFNSVGGMRWCHDMLRIHTRQGAALMDKRIVVALDVWDADSMYPNGHYVRTLGEIGKVETETVSQCQWVRVGVWGGMLAIVFLGGGGSRRRSSGKLPRRVFCMYSAQHLSRCVAGGHPPAVFYSSRSAPRIKAEGIFLFSAPYTLCRLDTGRAHQAAVTVDRYTTCQSQIFHPVCILAHHNHSHPHSNFKFVWLCAVCPPCRRCS